MRRVAPISLILVLAISVGVIAVGSQDPPPAQGAAATCDASAIDAESYRLTTEAQALNVLRPREPWWEPYGLWQTPREIGDVNHGALRLAERAKELDERNLLAHGYLARQMVVLAIDAQKAEEAWTRVLDNGGAIVWTATLPEVDPRSFFALAFDPRGLRIYRFEQLAGEVRTHFGFQEFPGPDREEFWRALGGCLPAGAVPEAEIAWSGIRDVRVIRRALRFDLLDRVSIESDRGNRRTDDALYVMLHGQSDLDPRFAMGPFRPRPYWGAPRIDPENYLLRVRQMLAKFFGLKTMTT